MRTGCCFTRSANEPRVALEVPRPVEVALGVGVGLGVGLGVAVWVGVSVEGGTDVGDLGVGSLDAADVGVEVSGEVFAACELPLELLEAPPNPIIAANTAMATTIAV